MQRGGDAGVVCHGIETSPALDIAARVTTGSAMPDGSTSHLDGPTDVLLYSVEDAIAETLYWRAQALGADMARIYVITGVIDVGDDMERALRLQFDWTAITHAVESTGAKLLILDPLIAAMQGDANSNSDVRRAIAGATRLGEDTGCAVLDISHLNKGMVPVRCIEFLVPSPRLRRHALA